MQTFKAPFSFRIADAFARLNIRKRTAYVTTGAAGNPEVLRSYWDSGSRDRFAAFDSTGKEIKLSIGGAPMFTAVPAAWIPNAGDMLVKYGVCMGKPATPTVTIYE